MCRRFCILYSVFKRRRIWLLRGVKKSSHFMIVNKVQHAVLPPACGQLPCMLMKGVLFSLSTTWLPSPLEAAFPAAGTRRAWQVGDTGGP